MSLDKTFFDQINLGMKISFGVKVPEMKMSIGQNNPGVSFLGLNSPRVKNLRVKNPAPRLTRNFDSFSVPDF